MGVNDSSLAFFIITDAPRAKDKPINLFKNGGKIENERETNTYRFK